MYTCVSGKSAGSMDQLVVKSVIKIVRFDIFLAAATTPSTPNQAEIMEPNPKSKLSCYNLDHPRHWCNPLLRAQCTLLKSIYINFEQRKKIYSFISLNQSIYEPTGSDTSLSRSDFALSSSTSPAVAGHALRFRPRAPLPVAFILSFSAFLAACSAFSASF